jgi:hypothetical protein
MKSLYRYQDTALLVYLLTVLFLSLTLSLLFVRPDASLNTTRKSTRVMVRVNRRGKVEEEALDWQTFMDSLMLTNNKLAY